MFDPALFDPEEERRRRRFLIPGAEEVGEQEVDVDGDATQGVASNPPNDARAGAYYVGPATRRYAEHLEAMPKQQPPGKLRRILAGLAGASSGYFGGTEAGVTSARDVLNEPYNRAMQRWGVEAGGRKTAADLERQEQVARTNELFRQAMLTGEERRAAAAEAQAEATANRPFVIPSGGTAITPTGRIEGYRPPQRSTVIPRYGTMVTAEGNTVEGYRGPTVVPRGGTMVEGGKPTYTAPFNRAPTMEEQRQRFFKLSPEEYAKYMGAGKVNVGMGELGQEAYYNQVQAAREIVTRDTRYAPFFQESAAGKLGKIPLTSWGAEKAQTARIKTRAEVPQDRASQQLFSEFLSEIEARISGMGRRARTAPPAGGRNPNFQEIGVK